MAHDDAAQFMGSSWLYDIIDLLQRVVLPIGPPMRNSKSCSSTVNILKKRNLPQAEKPFKKLEDGWSFITKIYPKWTSSDLPPITNSEKDTENWVFSVIVQPVIHCLRAIKQKTIRAIYDPDTNDCFSVSSHSESTMFPILDGLIVTSHPGKPFVGQNIIATVEVKTPNAMQPALGGNQGIFADMLVKYMSQVPTGTAMKFWYTDSKKFPHTTTTETRILLQVWHQMQTSRTQFAILSSYVETIFSMERTTPCTCPDTA
ncbi:uncharacterized protein PHACADRAFT_30145 [Phanerochaete carnosa HHB-10118-sp]|uniref:Uncharacterized protein n=1 Tax=Phanerochaete carnosa (strain HHB-10118-sp) TaxID=650164 RepID=K5USZ0_PHACS|nr:uncharacterized protein PHACADRAFT_30145 [Phanerochaete carnosa HHB-10118-sp]EKM53066.1 hypothetical protein PHACADRAFT_30145 [Phanerochaete carnosa HHB-10118-sp]